MISVPYKAGSGIGAPSKPEYFAIEFREYFGLEAGGQILHSLRYALIRPITTSSALSKSYPRHR